MSVPKIHPFDFDPTYGLGIDELLALRPPPAPPGFDGLWRGRYFDALGVSPRPELSESRSSHPNWGLR